MRQGSPFCSHTNGSSREVSRRAGQQLEEDVSTGPPRSTSTLESLHTLSALLLLRALLLLLLPPLSFLVNNSQFSNSPTSPSPPPGHPQLLSFASPSPRLTNP